LVKATSLDSSNETANEKSTEILNRALNICEKECLKRPNKKHQLKYMQAIIIFELAKLLYDKVNHRAKETNSGVIKTEKLNTMRPNIYKELIKVCKVS
jgi:hypothetical protein